MSGGYPYLRLTELDRRMTLRRNRQARLEAKPPLTFTALIGEGALRQEIGGPEVMRQQLLYLAEAAEQKDHIEIRVLPFSSGAHPAFGNSFEVLSFASPRLPDVVWHEVLNNAGTVDNEAAATDFVVTFGTTLQAARDAKQSITLIRRIAEEMT